MALYLGSTPLTGLKIGSVDIQSLYMGSTLIWTKTTLFDNFNRPNADTLGANWTDHGSSSTYKAGVVDGSCRLAYPDGQIVQTILTSRQRYNAATTPGDNGTLSVRVGSNGDGAGPSSSTYITDVFRRLSNAAFTHGVGIRMMANRLFIVRRVASVDTTFELGTYVAGDRLALTQTGNLHSLYRNGSFVGEWNDSGASASSGASFRSMGLRVDGAKDFFGPRRFSPSIDEIECT